MPTPAPDDLTARARIREAAVREFGEKGYDGATIRRIAAAAGVSSGLVRHHFGSKSELRDACDEHLVRTMQALNQQVRDNLERGEVHYVSARVPLAAYQGYLSRALVDGGAGAVFDALVSMTEEWLASVDEQRRYPSEIGLKARATVITAMALSIQVLQHHVSRGLGVDINTPEGELQVAATLVDIYANPLLTSEQAKSAGEDLARKLRKLHKPKP